MLDAVVREKGDLGSGILTKWLGRSKLKVEVVSDEGQYPALSAYLKSGKNTEGGWNPTQITEELARRWKPSPHGESFFPRFDRGEIESAIRGLLTIAEQWKSKSRRVNECARDVLSFLKRWREAGSGSSGLR